MNICFRQCIYKSMNTYSQMSVFSKKKMCVLITILLLVTCDLSTSTEIYNRGVTVCKCKFSDEILCDRFFNKK